MSTKLGEVQPLTTSIVLGLAAFIILVTLFNRVSNWVDTKQKELQPAKKVEEIFREWLDKGGYQTRIDQPGVDENFRLTVSGDINYSVVYRKRYEHVIELESFVLVPQAFQARYGRLSEKQQARLLLRLQHELLNAKTPYTLHWNKQQIGNILITVEIPRDSSMHDFTNGLLNLKNGLSLARIVLDEMSD